MPFRVGDVVDKDGVSYNVKNVDGSRILVQERLEAGFEGVQTWRSSKGFRLFATEWKEHITYVVTYRLNHGNVILNHGNVISSTAYPTEEQANSTKRTILRDPRTYTLLAMTKVTIPYKEPQ